MSVRGFDVFDVASGRLLGTATFDGRDWTTSSPSVKAMVSALTKGLGRTPDEVLDYYESWSNGYVRTLSIGG